jgi:hypothetical protein
MLSIQNTNALGGENKVLILFVNVEGDSIAFFYLKAHGTYSYHCACVMH